MLHNEQLTKPVVYQQERVLENQSAYVHKLAFHKRPIKGGSDSTVKPGTRSQNEGTFIK
jgi:hypothetical protein